MNGRRHAWSLSQPGGFNFIVSSLNVCADLPSRRPSAAMRQPADFNISTHPRKAFYTEEEGVGSAAAINYGQYSLSPEKE